jgi:hypothetical protein
MSGLVVKGFSETTSVVLIEGKEQGIIKRSSGSWNVSWVRELLFGRRIEVDGMSIRPIDGFSMCFSRGTGFATKDIVNENIVRVSADSTLGQVITKLFDETKTPSCSWSHEEISGIVAL